MGEVGEHLPQQRVFADDGVRYPHRPRSDNLAFDEAFSFEPRQTRESDVVEIHRSGVFSSLKRRGWSSSSWPHTRTCT